MSKAEIHVDDTVLLRNNKRFDRIGGKWLGHYIVTSITPKELVSLRNSNRKFLQKKYNIVHLKQFIEDMIEDSNYQSTSTTNETKPPVSTESRFWLDAPDEIEEMILLCALQQSGLSFPEHK